MGAAGIELPDFVTFALTDRTYQLVKQLRALGPGHPKAARHLTNGLNRAGKRDPRMLLLLEKGADLLQKENDRQRDRFEAHGLATTEYAEYAQWREAYIRVNDAHRREEDLQIYRWLFAACDAVLG